MEHTNVVFNGNGTITTIPVHPLQYIPEMSNGTENDLLILPNIALLVSCVSLTSHNINHANERQGTRWRISYRNHLIE